MSSDSSLLIGLVSISDRASAGVYEDKGLPGLVEWFTAALASPWRMETRLIPDEQPVIERTLIELVDTVGCHLTDDDPPIADSQTQTHFMTGATDEGTRIVAWTTNLHAAVGVSEWHRAGITERVAALAAVTESGSEA